MYFFFFLILLLGQAVLPSSASQLRSQAALAAAQKRAAKKKIAIKKPVRKSVRRVAAPVKKGRRNRKPMVSSSANNMITPHAEPPIMNTATLQAVETPVPPTNQPTVAETHPIASTEQNLAEKPNAPEAYQNLLVSEKTIPVVIEEESKSDEFITIGAHGLGARGYHCNLYHKESGHSGSFIEGTLVPFDFGDVDNPGNTVLGQEKDIQKLKEAVTSCGRKPIILFGWSRGAATIANYLGSQGDCCTIRAAVLESPFDEISSIVANKAYFRFMTSFITYIFPRFNRAGIQPKKVVATVNKDIPIFIYCSLEDKLIPASSSFDYYKALRLAGHNKVHILIIRYGEHANIVAGRDGNKVRNTIHAFYKNYNLPHNQTWAAEGQMYFARSQPEPTSNGFKGLVK